MIILRLGYVLEDGSIQYDDSWNDEDIEKLVTIDKYICKIYMYVMRIYILTSVKEDIENILKNLDIQSGSMDNLLRMERLIREYFVEAGMFISHWKKIFFDNKLGDTFDKITRTAYDNDSDYKMLDIVRNFVEHVDYLISTINFELPNKVFVLKRDKLLKGRLLTGNKRRMVSQLPEEINLVDVINGSFLALSTVEDEFMMCILQLSNYLPYCACFDKYSLKLSSYSCGYCFVETDDGERRYINIMNNCLVVKLIRSYYGKIFLRMGMVEGVCS